MFVILGIGVCVPSFLVEVGALASAAVVNLSCLDVVMTVCMVEGLPLLPAATLVLVMG